MKNWTRRSLRQAIKSAQESAHPTGPEVAAWLVGGLVLLAILRGCAGL